VNRKALTAAREARIFEPHTPPVASLKARARPTTGANQRVLRRYMGGNGLFDLALGFYLSWCTAVTIRHCMPKPQSCERDSSLLERLRRPTRAL